MKKILLTAFLIHCLPKLQTLDVNALRLAQKRMTKLNTFNTNYSANTSKSDLFILDKSVQPKDYNVGPGDKIHVNVISSNETFDYNLIISPSGALLIPSVGIINTNDLTLEKLIQLTKDKIKNWNLDAQVNVELEGIREFKILVTGHFKDAGYFTSTPISRLSDIFSKALKKHEQQMQKQTINKNENKGKDNFYQPNNISVDSFYKNRVSENSFISDRKLLSKRNIKIIRGSDTLYFDLQRFQSRGDLTQNPYIKQGDIINIPFVDYQNYIFGGIKNAGSYEFKYGDTLEDLITLSGGLKKVNIDTKAKIIHSSNFNIEPSYVNLNESNTIKLKPEDQIMIPYDKYIKSDKMIKITGEVKYPGIYPFSNSVMELIKTAGGLTDYADTNKIRIYNASIGEVTDLEFDRILLKNGMNVSVTENAYAKARIRSQKGYIEVKLKDLKKHGKLILTNDAIHVPTYYSYIEVIGAVNNPGRYPFIKGKKSSYYIDQSGGIIKERSSKKYLIKSSTGQKKKLKNNQLIDNTDIIFISEKEDYQKWAITKEVITAFSQIITAIVVIQRILETN